MPRISTPPMSIQFAIITHKLFGGLQNNNEQIGHEETRQLYPNQINHLEDFMFIASDTDHNRLPLVSTSLKQHTIIPSHNAPKTTSLTVSVRSLVLLRATLSDTHLSQVKPDATLHRSLNPRGSNCPTSRPDSHMVQRK
jgi:hypothetical protein